MGEYMENKAEELIDAGLYEKEQMEQNSHLNGLLGPTHIGIDWGSGPDRTVMKCACGWHGEPKDMKANQSGIRTCPGCGASGGVVGA